MLHIHAAKASAGLIQQLLPMHQNANAVAFTCRSLGNIREAHSLAAASRQYCKDTAFAELVLQPDVGYQLVLVGAKVHLSTQTA
jgi:hypothetical protein